MSQAEDESVTFLFVCPPEFYDDRKKGNVPMHKKENETSNMDQLKRIFGEIPFLLIIYRTSPTNGRGPWGV